MRPSAVGGFGPRDPKGRKSSAPFTDHVCRVRAARSGGGPKAQRVSPAPLKVATTFYRVRPVAHPPSGFAAGRHGRRFYEPQKHIPFIFGRSQRRTNIKAEAASKRRCASPPHPGAAGRPLPRGLSYSLLPQIPAQISSPMPSPARRENRLRFSRLKNRHGPKHGPVLRPVSASLRLRCRSAAFPRACAIHLYSATTETVESLL